MELLEPDWSQEKPTFAQARVMCQEVPLTPRPLVDPRIQSVLRRIRETHVNGGVLLASFEVGPSADFDWFASRSRLAEFGVLRQILARPEISATLPELQVQPLQPDDPALVTYRLGDLTPAGASLTDLGLDPDTEVGNLSYQSEFQLLSSFLFVGELAGVLHNGGAYTKPEGDGKSESESALAFSEALFGLRFSEVSIYSTHSAWAPWFCGIAWDWTALLFDRRARTLSVLTVTDTD